MKMFFPAALNAPTPTNHPGAIRILKATLRIVNPYYVRPIEHFGGA
jgi:hypothetical protein